MLAKTKEERELLKRMKKTSTFKNVVIKSTSKQSK